MTVVGRGPSLLRLTSSDFVDGPVITLNHAILDVRKLGLRNPIYAMQKDGCVPHRGNRKPPRVCRCPNREMVRPVMPETVVLSAAESSKCFHRYPNRIVIDVEKDFGLPWNTMSAPVAVRLAQRMGADEIRMLGFDAAHDDLRLVENGTTLPAPKNGHGYVRAVNEVREWARTADLDVRFLDPVSSA